MRRALIEGIGLHLRDGFAGDLLAAGDAPIDWLETTAENCIDRGPASRERSMRSRSGFRFCPTA